jgi:hypothetical protein
MGWIWRNPRTQQERRVNSGQRHLRVEVEVGGKTFCVRIHIRGKRSAAMLRNAWDDITKGRQRSWKKFRRTQYRAKVILTGEPARAETVPNCSFNEIPALSSQAPSP